jgi:hypothetical protein
MYSQRFKDLVNLAFEKSENLTFNEKEFGNIFKIEPVYTID